MASSENTASIQSPDSWVCDTFTWFDHDYKSDASLSKLSKRGYRLLGNWPYLLNSPSKNPLEAKVRVLLVGGSTTSVINDSTWSDYLFKMLSSGYESVAVFNGGCGLYNSFNEYMKISRDLLVLNPTHVISMSGVNDTNCPNYVSNGFAELLIPPMVRGNLYTRYNNDAPLLERVVRWLDESKNIYAICNAHNVKFYRFLQPCLCSNYAPYSELSSELQDLVIWMSNNGLSWGLEKYIQTIHKFYYSLSRATLPDYIHNIVDVLPNSIEYWHDARHPTDLGYQLIGKKVSQVVFDFCDETDI